MTQTIKARNRETRLATMDALRIGIRTGDQELLRNIWVHPGFVPPTFYTEAPPGWTHITCIRE